MPSSLYENFYYHCDNSESDHWSWSFDDLDIGDTCPTEGCNASIVSKENLPAFFWKYLDKYLGYRISIPDGDMPEDGWPVMIWGGGLTAGWKEQEPDDEFYPLRFPSYPATWIRCKYFTECVYIIPDVRDYTEWCNEAQLTPTHPEYIIFAGDNYVWGTWGKSLRKLIDDLINEEAIAYENKECTEIKEDYTLPKIDATKIYLGGYSFGAFSAFRVLNEFRDLAAGIFCLAGQPLGKPYRNHWSEPADPENPWQLINSMYNRIIVERTKLLAEAWCHIPIFMSVGTDDTIIAESATNTGMFYSCRAFALAMTEVCTERSIENKLLFRVIDTVNYPDGEPPPKGSIHNWSMEASPCFSSSNYLDPKVHLEQEFGYDGEDKITPMDYIRTTQRGEPLDIDMTVLIGDLSNLPYQWLFPLTKKYDSFLVDNSLEYTVINLQDTYFLYDNDKTIFAGNINYPALVTIGEESLIFSHPYPTHVDDELSFDDNYHILYEGRFKANNRKINILAKNKRYIAL